MSSLNPHMAHMCSEVNFHLIYYYVWTFLLPPPPPPPTYSWKVISFSSAFKTCYNGNKYAYAPCFCLHTHKLPQLVPLNVGGGGIDF